MRVPARDRLDEYKRKRDPQRTPEPAGDGAADGAQERQPLRRPGAPRHAPALGSAPRARRRRGLVGDPQRDPRGPEGEPPRRAHRGPSAGVPRVRGRHPEGRVRRRHDAHLGPRHVRDAQVRRRQGRDHLPRRAPARPLRPVSPQEAQGRAARQGLDDPPHGSRRGSDPRADARAARADARQAQPVGPAARRRPLGLRDQVGRRARARLLRAGPDPLREPQPQRHHELLSRAQGAQPGAELAPRDPRRRDRRLRRQRPAVVRAPAGPHAHRLRGDGAAADEGHAGRLRRLRPALARRPLAHGAALRGAPRAAAGAGAAGTALADARPRRRQRSGRPGGEPRERAGGRRRQAAGQPVPARPSLAVLAEGQERAARGRRRRRLAAGGGQAARAHRRAARRRARRRAPALRRARRHGLHREGARPARDRRSSSARTRRSAASRSRRATRSTSSRRASPRSSSPSGRGRA